MMHVLEDDSEAKVAMPPPRSDRSTLVPKSMEYWTLESVYRDSKCGPNMQMHVPSILTLDCFFISLNTVFPDTYTCVCSLSLMCSLDHH